MQRLGVATSARGGRHAPILHAGSPGDPVSPERTGARICASKRSGARRHILAIDDQRSRMAYALLSPHGKEHCHERRRVDDKRNVGICAASDSINDAARIMWERDCGCVPVVDDGGNVIGMITDRDICMAADTQGGA